MLKKRILAFSVILLLLFSFSVRSWEGRTHNGITTQIERPDPSYQGLAHKYLKVAGYPDGIDTPFTLIDSLLTETPNFEARIEKGYITKKSRPALDWLLEGSVKEDFPITRAQNHFHDPA